MLEVEVLLEICSRTVTYVPSALRTAAITVIFLASWGVNVRGFDANRVPFRLALGFHRHDAEAAPIFALCKAILVLWLLCLATHEMLELEGFLRARNIPLLCFWAVVFVFLGLSNRRIIVEIRNNIRDRLVCLLTFRDVRFIDVLVGDAMTSMANLFAESISLVCDGYGLVAILSSLDCRHHIISPALQTFPFVLRAWQCFVTWYKTDNRLQLINLGKYMAVIPVIWIPVLKHHSGYLSNPDQHDLNLDQLWLYSVIVYTVYAFTWDIFMDWGLCWGAAPGTHAPFMLRSTLLYQSPVYYYAAMVLNLLLRLCWTLKLSAHLQQHGTSEGFVLLFELLEVLRRFVWIFFRVEWECVKEGMASASPPSSPHLERVSSGSLFTA